MTETKKYPRFSPYFNTETLARLDQLCEWLGMENRSATLLVIISDRYQEEFAKKRGDVKELIQQFARTYSDKSDELTETERGYAQALLEVAETLGLKLDEMSDGLLDHIRHNKL